MRAGCADYSSYISGSSRNFIVVCQCAVSSLFQKCGHGAQWQVNNPAVTRPRRDISPVQLNIAYFRKHQVESCKWIHS